MERLIRFHWLALVAAGLVGCGQQGGEPAATDPAKQPASASAPTGTAKSVTSQPKAAAEAKPATPDQIVFQFLEAVRTGNDEKAAAMLTKTAREKTAEENLVVAPPGSDTAKFTVGEVEVDEEGGACVEAVWTDLDETGAPKSDRVLWLLRQEPEGWRIAGVAATIFEGEPPLLLNFEDPADMLRKQQQVRDEVERRITGETGEPASPTAPSMTAESNVTPPAEEARQPEERENPMRR